jgi:hypothetical protein
MNLSLQVLLLLPLERLLYGYKSDIISSMRANTPRDHCYAWCYGALCLEDVTHNFCNVLTRPGYQAEGYGRRQREPVQLRQSTKWWTYRIGVVPKARETTGLEKGKASRIMVWKVSGIIG